MGCLVAEFGIWLQNKMQAVGIHSQSELARRLGVSQPTVTRWANGQVIPSYETIRALARILEVSRMEVYQAFGLLPNLDELARSEIGEIWEQATPEERALIARIARTILHGDNPGDAERPGDGA